MRLVPILSLAIGLSLASCDDSKDWTLFVYPGGSGGFAIITPGFSEEMCRFAGQEAVRSHSYSPERRALIAAGDSGEPTFECGRQCRIGDIKTVATCTETLDAND